MDSTPPAATPPAYPGRCRPRAACHRPVLLSRPRPAGHALAVIGRASGPGRVTIGRDSGPLVSGARHVYVGAGRKAKTPADSAWPRGSATAMERDGQLLSARPALETEGLRYLHVTGESGRGPRARTASSPGRRHVRGLPASHLRLVHRLQLHPSLRGVSEAFHPAEGLATEAAGPSCGCRGDFNEMENLLDGV
uniref:selenoprotein S isoform X2 n=1 Tax=Halichoerus grypus TaxID=9711 RepID=UPI001659C828|nr:selenoprotein S isoform X2 [Halichoerus grypus]